MQAARRKIHALVVVTEHVEQGASKLACLQFALRVVAQHQTAQIGAVLLQLVIAIHFDKGEELRAVRAGWN